MSKGLRWCLFLFAALLLALRWPGPAALAASEDYSGSVTITFRESGGGGGSGGSGGSSSDGAVDRDRADPFPPDTVTVIRQEVPLSTLGPLPKTGSRRRAAELLLFGGVCCAAGGLAGLRKR